MTNPTAMDKLHDYQGIAGRFHQCRDNIKEFYEDYHSKKSTNLVDTVKKHLNGNTSANKDFSHVFRLVYNLLRETTIDELTYF